MLRETRLFEYCHPRYSHEVAGSRMTGGRHLRYSDSVFEDAYLKTLSIMTKAKPFLFRHKPVNPLYQVPRRMTL